MNNNTGNGLQSIDELISAQKPGYSLDQRFYTDPAIYELELERIIYRNWLLAGHHSELPNVGDYKIFSAGHESAIIVRGKDDNIRAFANVCRHRGSRVCLEEKGNAGKFTCPYHGWMYDIDGSLKAARDMPDEFDWAAHGLKPLSFDLIQGLMLVSFSNSPPGTEECKADLGDVLAMFGFENLKIAASKKYAIPANWKLSLENYQECYHCATAHPDYARMHTLMLDEKKRGRVQAHMQERMGACGILEVDIDRIDTSTRPDQMGYSYSRTALFEGYLTGSKDGKPVAPLLGGLKGYDGGASDISLGPCSYLLAYSDHVVCYVFTPIDLDNSQCEVYWLVRGDAQQGKDYDVESLMWLWDVTTESDKQIIANNSAGVHSRFYEPGPFSKMEKAESVYVSWMLKELQRS